MTCIPVYCLRIADTPWICHSIDSIFSVKNILAIYAQTQPTNLRASHITEQAHVKLNIGEKKLANCCDSPNSPKFFPSKVFYCMVDIPTCKLKQFQETRHALACGRRTPGLINLAVLLYSLVTSPCSLHYLVYS